MCIIYLNSNLPYKYVSGFAISTKQEIWGPSPAILQLIPHTLKSVINELNGNMPAINKKSGIKPVINNKGGHMPSFIINDLL